MNAADVEAEALMDRIAVVQAERPDLPMATALIVAEDALTADRATALVEDGQPISAMLALVGSYARMGWLLDMAEAGHLTEADVSMMLPRVWPISDPDDTDPRFLAAWMVAWHRNGRRTLLDDPTRPLPPGRRLDIFRGQVRGSAPGISWSLSLATAQRFAAGASLRVANPDPEVIAARVHRRTVMAYLTIRGEEEVIVDPAYCRVEKVALR